MESRFLEKGSWVWALVVVVPPILLQSLYTEIADLNQVPAHSASGDSSENCGLPLNK